MGGVENLGVTDAIVWAINSLNIVTPNSKTKLYSLERPIGREINLYDAYGVIDLDTREHATTLGKVCELSRCSFNLRLYGRNTNHLSRLEWIVKQLFNQISNIEYERFKVKNARLVSNSESKVEANKQDKRFVFTKSLSFFSDIVERESDTNG